MDHTTRSSYSSPRRRERFRGERAAKVVGLRQLAGHKGKLIFYIAEGIVTECLPYNLFQRVSRL